jgi:hypothetical protein
MPDGISESLPYEKKYTISHRPDFFGVGRHGYSPPDYGGYPALRLVSKTTLVQGSGAAYLFRTGLTVCAAVARWHPPSVCSLNANRIGNPNPHLTSLAIKDPPLSMSLPLVALALGALILWGSTRIRWLHAWTAFSKLPRFANT